MTEREWRFRRRIPALRATVRSAALRTTDYIGVVVWIALCAGAWSLVALSFWNWFLAAPFGIPRIGPLEAIGIALVGWVFREAAFGETRQPERPDLLAQPRRVATALLLGWVVHLCIVAGA